MSSVLVLLLLEIVLLLIAFPLLSGDIMAPSAMVIIMFFISTVFVLFSEKSWNVSLSYKTIAILITGLTAFLVAECIIKILFDKKEKETIYIYIGDDNSYEIDLLVFILFLIIDMIAIILYKNSILSAVGISTANVNMKDIYAAYRRLSIDKLSGGDVFNVSRLQGILLKIVIAQGYVSVFILINNFINNNGLQKKDIRAIVLLIGSVIPSIMTSGRNQFLMLFSAGMIGYYIIWHERNGWSARLSWKYIKFGVIALLIGIPVFYYSLVLLGRTTDRSIFDYASAYIGGSIVLFDDYVNQPTSRFLFGEETLYGVRKLMAFLHLGEISGLYNLERRPLGIGGGNVYTFFRRPYHDFGYFGMLIFTMLVSSFFALIYYGIIKKANVFSDIKEACVLFYMYIYYGIVIASIDNYSQSYISVGTISIMLIILAELYIIRNIKFRLRVRLL